MCMRQLLLFLFLFYACSSMAQIDLTVLPKAERDSTLVAIVQNLLHTKFPAYYRKNVHPVITEGKFVPSLRDTVLPDGVVKGEQCFFIKLYYDNWAVEDAFEWDYTANATVLAKSGRIASVFLGSGFGYQWPESDKVVRQKDIYAEKDSISAAWNSRMSALPRLSTLPQAERDSILVEILQDYLKSRKPKWYRRDVCPVISQGDFRSEGVYWREMHRKPFPKYIEWTDTCYYVTLYYPKWREEGFKYPYTAKATIREKSRELFHVSLGGKEELLMDWGVVWSELNRYESFNRISSYEKVSFRNERLEQIARDALKKKETYLPVDEFEISISEGDFEISKLDWLPQPWKSADYTAPTDICYKVQFYDPQWRTRKLDSPLIAEVYIEDTTAEVYRIDVVYDEVRWWEWEYRKTMKRNLP